MTFRLDAGFNGVLGPYSTTIRSFKNCAVPSRPYVKDTPLALEVLIYNTTESVLISGNATISRDTKNLKGPYRTTIRTFKDCAVPSRPYVKDTPMVSKVSIYNTTESVLVSGNVNISRDTKNAKFRMKGFIWKDDKWKVNYLMNDIGCHSMLLHLICVAVNIKYDRKNCMFLKGEYYFKDLNVNSIQHLWTSKMEYGKILWRSEVYNQKLGTFFCNELETITVPAG